METIGVKVTVNSCILLLMLYEIFPVMGVIGATCGANQAEVTFEGNVTQCCDTCAKGYGAEVECSSDNKTVCKPCFSGYTYSSYRDHYSSCKKCATCGNISHFVLHPCNVTQNTICGCPLGFYYDSEEDTCRNCTLCGPGWGVLQMCSARHDTICTPCVENQTFSDTWDYRANCKKCSECKKNKVVLQICSMTDDTLCFSMTAGHPDTSYNYSEPTVYTDDDDDDGDIIPVYCAVLGLLVVGLLGYVVFKHWIRVRAKRSHKAPCTHEDVEYSKASGADSGVFVDSDSPKSYNSLDGVDATLNSISIISRGLTPVHYNIPPEPSFAHPTVSQKEAEMRRMIQVIDLTWRRTIAFFEDCLSTRVRELPHGKRKELEKILTSPQSDSWKELAKDLGYASQRMAQFEPRAKNDTVSPFKRMLHDWERRETATTGLLIQSLRNIGRDDAAKVLYYDTAESRTQLISKQNSVV